MELTTFARTKIQPPRIRAHLIERPDLDAKVAFALRQHRLVLCVAPAGYGKTATLSRQARFLPESSAFAWVTTDAEDNLRRLLSCLVEALEPYDLPWRVAPETLDSDASSERGLHGAADALVNALGATSVEHGVIVLDDLHAVTDTRVFDFLAQVLEGLPDHWTLAIGSRVDPALPLSRLRARQELAEFRQPDLAFTRGEIDRLCPPVPAADREDLVDQLELRTQGWPAGVSLSLETPVLARGAAAPVAARLSQRHLHDYLASEVFDQMPAELRDFLLSCSVLPELEATRCALVSGNMRAASLIEDVERRGLFVSVLEGDELTLRLHDLFRDFLDDRLRRRHPDLVPVLLRRAANSETDPTRKLGYLMRAGETQEAEAVLVDVAMRMLVSGDSAHVVRMLKQFPLPEDERSPQLPYLRGLCAWLRFEFFDMQATMHAAAAGFEAAGMHARAQHARAFEAIAMLFISRIEDSQEIASALLAEPLDLEAEILGQLANYWLTCVDGPVWAPGRHLDRMVDLLVASGRTDLWTFCASSLYIHVDRAGVTEPVERLLRAASTVVRRGDIPLQAALGTINTKLLLMRGRVQEARVALQRLHDDHVWLGAPTSLFTPLQRMTTWFHILRGDGEAAQKSAMNVSRVDTSFTPIAGNWLVSIMYFIVAQNAIATDDAVLLRQASIGLDEADRAGEWPSVEGCRLLARGAVALWDGRVKDALPLLRAALAVSDRLGGLGKDGVERFTLARAELRNGSAATAWQVLQPLVKMVAAQNLVGILMLQGPGALEEIARGIGPDVAPAEDLALIGDAARRARELHRQEAGQQSPEAPVQVQNKLLSAREMEVLAHLAAGESNKVIARALHLSPHTVKRHVAHILARLDVATRGQAAAWYQNRRGATS